MSGLYEANFVAKLGRGVEGLLRRWELSPRSEVSLLTVSENATFRVIDPATDRRVVVRVHRPGYHAIEEIVSELAWIEALRADAVVATPAPLALVGGGRIASFEEAGETRHVVAFEFMTGAEPSADAGLADGFGKLGAISARLHAHARDWARPEGFRRKTWDFDTTIGDAPHWGRWTPVPDLDPNGRDVLERAVAELKRRTAEYGHGAARFGLIHADLRLANLLDDGERLGVIDFDDCGFSWFCYDFAAAVSFIEEEPFVPGLLDAWCSGYRSVASLDAADEAMIPPLVMLRRIQLSAWLAGHAETPTAEAFGPGFTAGTVRLARAFLDNGTPFDPHASRGS